MVDLVIENGDGLPNANSFVSIDEARIYALNRGVTLSAVDDEIAIQLIKSTDYLNSLECEFKSMRLNEVQSLCFPRVNVGIPQAVKNAQCQAVIEQANGYELMPTVSATNYVTKEKIDTLEITYADPIQAGIAPSFPIIKSLLFPLMKSNCSTGFGFRTIRV